MKKIIIISLLLIGAGNLIAQNRTKFKHRLSQKMINDAGFVLLNYDEIKKSHSDLLTIGGENKLKCLVKLDSKGNIFVDFWTISSGKGTIRESLFKKVEVNERDEYYNQSGIVNSQTKLNVENPPKLSDGRNKIGMDTKPLCIPFRGRTFGVATIPFRWRNAVFIKDSEKVNATVSSPKPDISFTGGWTFGRSVITNRSMTNYSTTIGFFTGLSSTEIKDGVVKDGSHLYGTVKTTKQSQTNPTVSYGGSVTFARNNFGLIIAVGYDNSIGIYSNDWIYQRKPWVGIGLSANLGIL